MLLTIKKRFAVKDDLSLVGCHDTGDALERHALAAAGSAEQRHGAAAGFEFGAEREAAELFFNVYYKAHALCRLLPLPERFFFSSMFTMSSTTAEMAMFTSTHLSANASLFVCQS